MKTLNLKSAYCKLNKDSRLYQLDIPIIALTGGIASGKTTVSKILKSMSFPIIDADQLVKEIYMTKESIDFLYSLNPNYIQDKQVNFKALRVDFFNKPELKQKIENFIYQRIESSFKNKLNTYPEHKFIIYEIALLFEKKKEKYFDLNVCVYCPLKTQIKRLIDRDQISEQLAQKIINQQEGLEEKKLKSDYIINNSNNLDSLNQSVERFISKYFE